MKNTQVQTNFTAGEVSPLLHARFDVARYQNGLKRSRNMIGFPQGGVARRPSTQHRNMARAEGRLIEFVFSSKQAYVLEFTSGRIRFFRDGAQILDSSGNPYEVPTPYSLDDVNKLGYTQSADVLYLTHPDFQPRTLSRKADDNWTLALFETADGPYLSNPVYGVSMTVSGLEDTAELVSNVDLFVPVTDNDKYISFQEDDQWRLGRIIEVYDARRAKIRYLSNVMLGLEQSVVLKAEGPVAAPYGRISPVAKIGFTAGTVTSDHQDTFTTQDAGKVIRVYDGTIVTTSGAGLYTSAASPGRAKYWWFLLTAFKDSDEMNSSSSFGAIAYLGGPSEPGTYKDYNVDTVRVTMQNRTILATLTSSAATFKSTDVGRHIRLNFSSAITWGKIRSYGSSSVVSVQLYEGVPLDPDQRDNSASPITTQLSNNGVTTKWQLGAWSNTTGWPSVCTFYQQRLFFGRTNTEPQTLWGSVGDDFPNFAPTELDSTVTDTNAVTFTLASTQLNEIVWMVGAKALMVGTTEEEWNISAESPKETLTSKNFRALSSTANGSCANVRPVRVGKSVVFVDLSKKKVHKILFDFAADDFVTQDLTIIADHILREGGGAKSVVLTKGQQTIIWALREDGKLASLVYEEEQEVYGWHLQELAGTQTKVVSITAVPDPETGEDVLYLLVCRVINGQQNYCVESLRPFFFEGQTEEVFLDASLTYTGSPVTTVTGLSHLEGERVSVVADGAYVGTQVVTGGRVTIESPAYTIHVGLHYDSRIVMLPPVVTNRHGAGMMHVQGLHSLKVSFFETRDFFYGMEGSELLKESFRSTSTPNNAPSPLLSGIRTVNPWGSSDRAPAVELAQLLPYPLTILGVASDIAVADQP